MCRVKSTLSQQEPLIQRVAEIVPYTLESDTSVSGT